MAFISNIQDALKGRIFSFFITASSAIFILVSYNWIRSASPSIFMQYYSKDLIPVAMAVMALSLAFFLYFYNKTLSFFGPKNNFHFLNFFFVAVFFIHYYLLKNEVREAAFSLFVIKDIYIMVMIEQIWAYFNTFNSKSSARILSGPLMAITSLGPIFAGKYLATNVHEIGSLNVVFYTGLILMPCSLFFQFASFKNVKNKIKTTKEKTNYGLKELRQNPTLLSLFFVIFASQALAATTTLRLQSAVGDFILGADLQTSYFANYYSNINALSSFFQLALTPLILIFLPLSWVHIIIPLIHCFLGISVLLNSDLQMIMLASLIFKSLDYSIFRGAKEMIYVPLSQDVKYRTKQVIDVFAYRSGKGLVSTILGILKNTIKVGDSFYSVVALGSAIIWLFLGTVISKHLKKD
jgi:AAA family ATP:ADP antiporter